MIKKVLLIVIAFVCSNTILSNSINDGGGIINLKPGNGQGGNGPSRSPEETVDVQQDGLVLTFPTIYESCMVCLADEGDDIVFTGYVGTDDTVTLPTTLSGTYTLILYVDDIIYYGYVEL